MVVVNYSGKGFGDACSKPDATDACVFFISIGETRHDPAFCLKYFYRRFTVHETVGSNIVGYHRLASDDVEASEGFRYDDKI